ncbi:MAG: TraB/GumN family protein [Gammaproteobacteria bacterium]|nr:TraB/GumN family protein [Gammaproteobacteria bacterium]
MKKLLLLLFLAGPTFADDDEGHPVTLCEITGDQNSIFLLGSVHLLRSIDYPLPSAFNAVYDQADVLIMEVDMDDIDPFAAQAAFVSYGVLQDDRTLADLMGEEHYSRAEKAAAAIDIPLDMLGKTEPWYAAMTAEMMVLNRIGFDPTLGIEMHMTSKATRDGKPIEGFETIEEQIQFLDGMSMQAQRDMLLSTLEQGAEISEIMDELIVAWRRGDIEYLEDAMLDELAEHQELNKAIVTDRNNRWVEQIDALLDDNENYLIIVGALHLVGENGVPKQLERRGTAIRQLSEPATLR